MALLDDAGDRSKRPRRLEGWTRDGDAIRKEFDRGDFVGSVEFVRAARRAGGGDGPPSGPGDLLEHVTVTDHQPLGGRADRSRLRARRQDRRARLMLARDGRRFRSGASECAAVDVRPEGEGPFPCVVAAHGFGALKEGGPVRIRRALRRARATPASPSTTATGARAAASRASCSTSAASTTTTAPRSPSRGRCPASIPSGSCSGARRSAAATWSRSPPAIRASPR